MHPYAVPSVSNYMLLSPEISNGLSRVVTLAFTPAVSALQRDAIMGLSSGQQTVSAGWKAKYENTANSWPNYDIITWLCVKSVQRGKAKYS